MPDRHRRVSPKLRLGKRPRYVLPYPLDTLQEAEVRDIARAHYRPFLRTLGL